ncbi:MAG: translocation protein TolB [Pelotomaculum sp. PtaB.Bin104]|nr:MAG: translocation protein TolB [Pelotomaculum sp. PtaB.Bin104]
MVEPITMFTIGVNILKSLSQQSNVLGADNAGHSFLGEAFGGAISGLSQCIYPTMLGQNQQAIEEKRQLFMKEQEALRREFENERFQKTKELQLEMARLSHEYRLAEQQASFNQQLEMMDWNHFYQHSWPLVVSPLSFRCEPKPAGAEALPKISLRVFVSNSKPSDYKSKVEDRVIQGLYDFVSTHYEGSGPRPVDFYDKGWRETHKHGGAYIKSLNRMLKGQPTLIIDPVIEGDGEYLNLRVSFWGLGEIWDIYEKTFVRLPLKRMYREAARAHARHWQQIKESLGLDDSLSPNDAINLRTLNQEERLKTEKNLAPETLEQLPFVQMGYKFDDRHYQTVAESVRILHCLIVAWVADAYHMAEYGTPPLMPELLPKLMGGEYDPGLMQLFMSGFRQLYSFLERKHNEFIINSDNEQNTAVCIPRWCVLPEFDLAFARSFAQLPDKSWAWDRIDHSLKTWVTLRGEQPVSGLFEVLTIVKGLLTPADLGYAEALRDCFVLMGDSAASALAEEMMKQAAKQSSGDEMKRNLINDFKVERDPFETMEEYRARIVGAGMLPAGQARLIKDRYDIETGRFPLEISWQDWAVPLAERMSSFYRILVPRDQAMDLYSNSSLYPVLARLALVGNKVSIVELSMYAVNKSWKIFSVYNSMLCTLEGNGLFVNSVTFSPDGQLLASGSNDDKVILWEVESGKPVHTLLYGEHVCSVAFSPDGRLLASCGFDSKVKIWEVESGKLVRTLKENGDIVMCVAFSPDGQLLAVANYYKTIKLWEVESGWHVRTLKGHGGSVTFVTFSPDGRLLASSSFDKTIKLWEVESGKPVHTLEGHGDIVMCVEFSPDGRLLASGSSDKIVKFWEVRSGRLVHTLEGHEALVKSVTFSPDGWLLASGSDDKTIKLWEVESGRLVHTLEGHGRGVFSVAFSPDGQLLASGSDNKIRLWG